ncbi:MAG: TIGR02996 domain-containing protein [Gemmataceae bacterium]
MTDEAAFLATIAANPADRVARLAYADWLDEQNRPDLADLLKLDIVLADIPPWQDRYWELKDAPEWLMLPVWQSWWELIGPVAERGPLFRDVPADWKSRWRVLRAFVERWWGVPMGDIDSRPKAADAAEEIAGRKLPPSVREWAMLLDEAPESRLDLVGRFERFDASGVTIIATSWGCRWGVRDTDLRADDPPVIAYVNAEEYESDATGEPFAATMTEFALIQLLRCWGYLNRQYEAVASFDGTAARWKASATGWSRFGDALVFEWPGVVAALRGPGIWDRYSEWMRSSDPTVHAIRQNESIDFSGAVWEVIP